MNVLLVLLSEKTLGITLRYLTDICAAKVSHLDKNLLSLQLENIQKIQLRINTNCLF